MYLDRPRRTIGHFVPAPWGTLCASPPQLRPAASSPTPGPLSIPPRFRLTDPLMTSPSPALRSPLPPGSDRADRGTPRDARSNVAPGDIAVGVVIGRASEYFDFFVYGIASVLAFPAVFFPFASRLEGTLYAFVLFAFAFVVRPLGTLAGMRIQRRFGRGTKLTVALFLLGSSTAGMALLPGYASLGALSIVLLTMCRIGQGLAL